MRLSGDLFTRCRKMGAFARVRRCREVGPATEKVARQARQRKRSAPAALRPKRWNARVGWLGFEEQPGVGQTSGDGANRKAACLRNSSYTARLDLMRLSAAQ